MPRATSSVRSRAPQTLDPSQPRGSALSHPVAHTESTDAKGVLERVVLQKTDEVKGLDHKALAFTLVSAAHDGEPPTTRRYKFTDKETFSTWAHGLMVAIKFSERRTRRGSLVQLMGSSDGQAIKVSADL